MLTERVTERVIADRCTLFLVTLVLTMSACTSLQVNEKLVSVHTQPALPTAEASPTAELPPSPTPWQPGCLQIPSIPVEICVPDDYLITINQERNRRGSFVSYDLRPLDGYHTPYLSELQFFSAESIAEFTANCGDDSPCFFGDYPDLERYIGQRESLLAHEGYEDGAFLSFSGRDFIVRSFPCHGDACLIREYTTFLGNVKLDIWIVLDEESQVAQGDLLLTQLTIREE